MSDTFRELVYRLRARPGHSPRQLSLLLCRGAPSLIVETTVAHLDERGSIWRTLHVRGDPNDLQAALKTFAAYAGPALVEKRLLGRTRHGAILWYKYRVPRARSGFSNTSLAFRLLGRDTVITDRARSQELQIRVLSRSERDLRGFFARVQTVAAASFDVQLLYLGPPRSFGEATLTPDEERLLGVALASGFFDVPRRAGSAEVGRRVGRSASAVSAALRRITAKLARAQLGL